MTWHQRHAALLREEVHGIARRYPGFSVVSQDEGEDQLAFAGTLQLGTPSGVVRQAFILLYPADFPLEHPRVVPVKSVDRGPLSSLLLPDNLVFYSARHQMKEGSLCLFEAPHAAGAPLMVSGVDALQRALTWWRCARKGEFPAELDSIEADLSAHYESHGDVLLGPGAAGATQATGGRMLVVRVRDDDRPLYAASHIEFEEGLVSDLAVLGRVYPTLPDTIEKRFGTVNPTAKQLDGVFGDEVFVATRWFAISREPPPVGTIRELAPLIFPGDADPVLRLSREFAVQRAGSGRVILALRYPARQATLAPAWLFLVSEVRDDARAIATVSGFTGVLVGTRDAALVEAWERGRLGCLRVHDLRRPALELRNSGTVAGSVGDLKLTLAGAGSLGAVVADLLAKSGVGELAVWDPARFDAANAIRHTGCLLEVGFPKALSVALNGVRHNPYVPITIHAASVNGSDSTAAVWKYPNVVSTIAEDAAELMLNQRACSHPDVTVYYLRALRRGSAGRLVRVRPGSDACFECLAHHYAEGGAEARALMLQPEEGEVVARECGHAVLAASAADLAVVGAVGVRIVLADILQPGDTNQWVWSVSGVPDHPGLQFPFTQLRSTLKPHRLCSVCRPKSVSVVRVKAGGLDQMLERAKAAAPNETGGILVGRRRGSEMEVLAVSDAGPNAVSRPERFERDGPHCQRFLEQVAREQGPGVDYVGEWHSHPGGSGGASWRDSLSLAEIASDGDYLTEEPVMVIVGIPKEGAPDIRASVHPRSGHAYPVPLDGTA